MSDDDPAPGRYLRFVIAADSDGKDHILPEHPSTVWGGRGSRQAASQVQIMIRGCAHQKMKFPNVLFSRK